MAFISAACALLLHDVVSWNTILLVAGFILWYGFGFSLNDFYDAPFDAFDETKSKRNYFVHNSLSLREAGVIICVTFSFVLIAFCQFGIRGFLVLVVGTFFAWAYVAQPLRLKSRPVVDVIVHAIFVITFPYISCLFILLERWTLVDIFITSVAISAASASQLEQQVRDYYVDLQTNTTFTTRYGVRTSNLMMKLLTSLAVLVFIIGSLSGLITVVLLPLVLFSIPYLVHMFIRSETEVRSDKVAQISLRIGVVYLIGLLLFSAINGVPFT